MAMDERDFEQIVEQVLESIPPELWARVENVRIAIEDAAPDDADLYGAFDGVALPLRTSWDPLEQPSCITIYRAPLIRDFGRLGAQRLREQIRITVLHEIGHYFGLDEGRLDELGYS
jgi:predicted Zn-dependent protease with MMP-like domain